MFKGPEEGNWDLFCDGFEVAMRSAMATDEAATRWLEGELPAGAVDAPSIAAAFGKGRARLARGAILVNDGDGHHRLFVCRARGTAFDVVACERAISLLAEQPRRRGPPSGVRGAIAYQEQDRAVNVGGHRIVIPLPCTQKRYPVPGMTCPDAEVTWFETSPAKLETSLAEAKTGVEPARLGCWVFGERTECTLWRLSGGVRYEAVVAAPGAPLLVIQCDLIAPRARLPDVCGQLVSLALTSPPDLERKHPPSSESIVPPSRDPLGGTRREKFDVVPNVPAEHRDAGR